MKKLLLLFFCVFIYAAFLQAQTITAKQNGNWSAASTWDLNRIPVDNDLVVIPAGKTVSLVNTPYAQNNFTARPYLRIRISGTLDFSSPGNDKLYLDQNSIIQVFSGGKITTTSSSTEIISIYNGTSENIVWDGTPTTIHGDVFATGTSTRFSTGVLPLKFVSFFSVCNNGSTTLHWTTSEEQNVNRFAVEKSTDARNWNVIGTVQPATVTGNANQYSFEDVTSGNSFYRITEHDNNGKVAVSTIIQTSCNTGITFRVFPNPVMQWAFVTLAAKETSTIQFSLFNTTGVALQTFAKKVQPGINNFTIDMAGLPKGSYVLRASGRDEIKTIVLNKVR